MLRDKLAEAIQQMRGNPCNPDNRKAFFDAFTAQGWAMTRNGQNTSDEQGAAFWRTGDDQPLAEGVERLQSDGYVTQDELARAMLVRRFGDAAPQSIKGYVPEPDRCQRPDMPHR